MPLEVVEDLLNARPGDHASRFLSVLGQLLFEVNVEEAQFVDLRLLSKLLSRIIQAHDQLEEVIEEVAVALYHPLLVPVVVLGEPIDVEALIHGSLKSG